MSNYILAFLEEIASAELELKKLMFKKEVLQDEKSLLDKFADHISKVHSVEVGCRPE